MKADRLFAGLLLFVMVLGNASGLNAQTTERTHKGFYLSMGLGPVTGTINMDSNTDGVYDMKGTGALFDLKIGGAIKENLILHGTLLSSSMVGPKLVGSGGFARTSNKLNVMEAMIGGGVTYYVMPVNILLSGSVGVGNFSVHNAETDFSGSTDRGVGFQLKVGKEWWVSRKYGLGVALTYNKTSVNNRPDQFTTEKMNSNRFGILFNASLN